MLIAQKRVN